MWTRPIKPGISISQAGFGAATGGTLGCFVEDVTTGHIMLLGNMHVLQFFQSAPKLGLLPWTPQSQLDIVQPCTSELKMMVEQNFRLPSDQTTQQSMARVWASDHPDKPAPGSVEEMKTYYKDKCNQSLATYIKTCKVATYARGALAANFDAAVATLTPGTRWENITPDGTTILAPPPVVSPAGRLWKYGDASGVKKYANGAVSVGNVNVPFKTYTTESASFETPNSAFTQVPVDFQANHVWLITGENPGMFQVQGDSGSALCDANNRLIGLMSTGGMGNTGYAIPIDVVFAQLNIRFPAAASGIA